MVKFKKIGITKSKPVKDASSSEVDSDVSQAKAPEHTVTPKMPTNPRISEFLEKFHSDYAISVEHTPDADIPFDSDEEDVFLMRVPRGFNVEALVGKKIHLDRKTKLGTAADAAESKAYELIPTEMADASRTCLTQVGSTGKMTLRQIKPEGLLVLRESVADRGYGEDFEEYLEKFNEDNYGVIELPTDLKVRHPLLGADYKKELASRAQALVAANKLIKREKKDKDESSPKKKSKKQKACEGKSQQAATVVPMEVEERREVTPPPKPEKKRKRKAMETTADLQWLENI